MSDQHCTECASPVTSPIYVEISRECYVACCANCAKRAPVWAWNRCPGCKDPMEHAPCKPLRFKVTDDQMTADALLLNGWKCGGTVFGTVIRIQLEGKWQDYSGDWPHGFVYLTELEGRTVKCVS